jgi:YD repeat-containing protein
VPIKPGDLTSVRYPGGAVRTFRYAEPDFISVPEGAGALRFDSTLTGVFDESGVRISTYRYDYTRRVTASEPPNGVNQYAFGPHPQQYQEGTTVTTPLGAAVVYAVQSGRVTTVSQPAGAGSAACSNQAEYDSLGRALSRTDFTNRKTCYGNDLSRNLETARLEGLTSASTCPTDVAAYMPAVGTEQRKVLTQWHPDWRLEARRAEPKKLTTWVYNGQPDPTAGGAITTCAPTDALVDGKPIAMVCKEVEQATSDETGGAGFGATAVGTAQVQRWTYNRWGQKLTHDGARTDVSDVTTYEYYPDTQADWTMGDLKQVTNALGQLTRYTRYDRNGRLLQQLDANGTVTDYAYTPRGWLTQVQVTPSGGGGSQTTVYEYDAVGQMTRATLPDGSYTSYTYDAARRLTQVADSASNRVDYTLDAMGNRTREEWKDPGGTLRKTLTRSIDALNRVQQVVGQ